MEESVYVNCVRMKKCDRKTRIKIRWTNFCVGLDLTERIEEPDFMAYLNYIDWMLNHYSPKLILKICGDLVCYHMKLYNRNPLMHELVRLRIISIKDYAKM